MPDGWDEWRWQEEEMRTTHRPGIFREIFCSHCKYAVDGTAILAKRPPDQSPEAFRRRLRCSQCGALGPFIRLNR